MRGLKQYREMSDEELVEAIVKHEVFIELAEERFGKDCKIIPDLKKDQIRIYGNNDSGMLVISEILDMIRTSEPSPVTMSPS